MTKPPCALLALAALCLLLTGCAHQPALTGTWNSTTRLPDGRPLRLQITLRPDGTFSSQAQGEPISYQGTYTETNGILTETVTGYTVGGRALSLPTGLPDAQAKRFAVQVAATTLTMTPQTGGEPTVWQRAAPP